MCIPWIMTLEVYFPFSFLSQFLFLFIWWGSAEKYMRNLINLISFLILLLLLSFRVIIKYTCTTSHILHDRLRRVPYMGKGTFSIIVNQTEAKAKTPSTDSQFLIPGFPASKLRAEKMVLSSYGLKLSNGKGKVIKYAYTKMYPRH